MHVQKEDLWNCPQTAGGDKERRVGCTELLTWSRHAVFDSKELKNHHLTKSNKYNKNCCETLQSILFF